MPETTWIGRVRITDDGPEHPIRVRTDGAAPGPEDLAERIADPFADPHGDPWATATAAALPGHDPAPLGTQRFAPPVRARKVIGVGRNYRAHAEELGNEVPTEPLLFFKSPTCLLASGDPIVRPAGYERVDMESELVVVIGKRARHVSKDAVWRHVAGYTLGNDVSNRDLQKKDKQWTRAKGFDTFGPLGPMVRMTEPGFVPPIDAMSVRGWLDDEVRQEGSCALMIFDIPTVVAYLSACMTLEPGDLIYTGTPAGVSPLQPGNVVKIRVEGWELGTLTNPVVGE